MQDAGAMISLSAGSYSVDFFSEQECELYSRRPQIVILSSDIPAGQRESRNLEHLDDSRVKRAGMAPL